VLQALSKARVLSEKLGDNNQQFIALCGEASYHMISGNLRAADELGHQCLELAQASGDANLLLEAHHRQWATKHFMGDYATAEAHIEFGITTYDPDKHKIVSMASCTTNALAPVVKVVLHPNARSVKTTRINDAISAVI